MHSPSAAVSMFLSLPTAGVLESLILQPSLSHKGKHLEKFGNNTDLSKPSPTTRWKFAILTRIKGKDRLLEVLEYCSNLLSQQLHKTIGSPLD